MSLIHEALKKVERQRQLGKAPTLDTPGYQQRTRRRWLLPALSMAVVIAAVLLVFLWRSPEQTQASPNPLAESAIAVAPAPATTAPRSSAATRKPGSRIARSTPVAPAGNPVPPTPVTPATATTSAASTDAWIALPPSREQAPAPPVQQVGTRQAADTGTQIATPESADNAKPVAAPAAKPVKPLPTKPTTASTPVTKSASSTPPMYWDLPYPERKDLPAFQISMHVYAANPAERFVILNGVRQVEGDELPSGLTLTAIRIDGIVLEADGKRFMVPRNGGY